MSTLTSAVFPLTIAPAQVIRGREVLPQSAAAMARLGQRPLMVGGDATLTTMQALLHPALAPHAPRIGRRLLLSRLQRSGAGAFAGGRPGPCR